MGNDKAFIYVHVFKGITEANNVLNVHITILRFNWRDGMESQLLTRLRNLVSALCNAHFIKPYRDPAHLLTRFR